MDLTSVFVSISNMRCFNKHKSQWPDTMKFLIHIKTNEDVSYLGETCMRLFSAQTPISCGSTTKPQEFQSGFSAPGRQTGEREYKDRVEGILQIRPGSSML